MARYLCCHKDCPVYRDIDVPVDVVFPPWYCEKHRGRTEFRPRPKLNEPRRGPQPK